MPPTPSLYWYDLETTGLNSAKDRIMQFAGQRTDYDLNAVGEAFVTYVKLPPEVAPSPEACVLTGISPQKTAGGLSEWDAFNQINAIMSEPQTCVLGYNSIRFDDEFIRYGLYRNLFDPYEREWKSGNRRSDFINVVRMAAAIRPDGVTWPLEEGKPTFSLERIAAANNIDSEGAHDAMVDVTISIGLAQKIKTAQPRLWDYALANDRTRARSFVEPLFESPFLHTSMYYGNARYCVAPVLAVAKHPKIQNRYVLVDLMGDLDVILNGSPREIREHWFSKNSEEPRLPLYTVALNQLPLFAPINTLNVDVASRVKIDLTRVQKAVLALQETEDLEKRLREVLTDEPPLPIAEFPDEQLYWGFPNDTDKGRCTELREAIGNNSDWPKLRFDDKRLSSLEKLLRARLRPDDLSESEAQEYEEYVRRKLSDAEVGTQAQLARVEQLFEKPLEESQRATLSQLKRYLQELGVRYGV